MAQNDQTTASLAARLRAEIRAEIEAGLRIPRAAVPPLDQAQPQPRIQEGGDGPILTIPAVAGRPALHLPPGRLPALPLPSALQPGLVLTYARSDALDGELVIPDRVSGFRIVHLNAANPTVVSFDDRHYAVADPQAASPVSTGSNAELGNEMSAGVAWIHPALLALLLGASAPPQADGVTVERTTYPREGTSVDAVRIAKTVGDDSSYLVYDLETGLLLDYEARTAGRYPTRTRFLSRRRLELPWANTPLPSWVGTTRQLVYEGSNTISLLGSSFQQSMTLTIALDPPNGGVARADLTAVTSLGMGAPEERSSWDMACASPMLYPLWIAPEVLRSMRPSQVVDADPVTGFTMTFSGTEGGHGIVVEEGPLERTSYSFSLDDGLFSGFRGERPYGAIAGARAQTETWLRSRT